MPVSNQQSIDAVGPSYDAASTKMKPHTFPFEMLRRRRPAQFTPATLRSPWPQTAFLCLDDLVFVADRQGGHLRKPHFELFRELVLNFLVRKIWPLQTSSAQRPRCAPRGAAIMGEQDHAARTGGKGRSSEREMCIAALLGMHCKGERRGAHAREGIMYDRPAVVVVAESHHYRIFNCRVTTVEGTNRFLKVRFHAPDMRVVLGTLVGYPRSTRR